MTPKQQTTPSNNLPSGFQRFETVIPPKTMSLEYEYQSFEDNAQWGETRSVLLREMRGEWEQREDFPYYAIDEKAHGRWSGSTHVRDMGDTNASGETVGYSIVQKWETRLSNLLDRFGCGHVSSIGDNDLASEIGYTPPKH